MKSKPNSPTSKPNTRTSHHSNVIDFDDPRVVHAERRAEREFEKRAKPAVASEWTLLSFDDVLNLPDPEKLVEGMLVEGSMFSMFGDKGSYKSFIALDLALSIAAGVDWQGRETQPGHAVYIAGEGAPGLKRRIAAWVFHHGLRAEERTNLKERFHVLGHPAHLVSKSDRTKLVKAIKAAGASPRLIVVDTLARNFGDGDENSTRDMNQFVKGCDEIKGAFEGVTLGIVHHVGKNAGRGSRGASSLPAALDTEIKVKAEKFEGDDDQDAVGAATIYCEKQKDGPEFQPETFVLRRVRFDDGQTSLVLDEVDPTVEEFFRKQSTSRAASPDKQEQAFKALGGSGIRRKDWLENSGLPESTFNRAVKQLLNQGRVEKVGRLYQRVKHDD